MGGASHLILVVAALMSADAPPGLVAAREAYTGLRFEEALAHLDRAVAQPSQREAYVELLELQGLALAVLGRNRDATGPFRKLLMLDPEHKLPEYVAPRFRALFTKVRNGVAQGGFLRAKDATQPRASASDPVFVSLRLENDPMVLATRLRAYYRGRSDGPWERVEVPANPTTRVRLDLPPNTEVVHYAWTLLDDVGHELMHVGSRETPMQLRVLKAAETPVTAAETSVADETPVWKQWWLWTAVGVVVAGAVTATVIVSRPDTPNCPAGASCADL